MSFTKAAARAVSVLAGFLVSLTFSYHYWLPVLTEEQEDALTGIAKVVTKLRVNMDGYGVLWCLIAVGFAVLFYRTITDDRFRPGIFEGLLSLLFGFLNYCGNSMYYTDDLLFSYGTYGIIQVIALTLGWAAVFRVFLFLFMTAMDRGILRIPEKADGTGDGSAPKGRMILAGSGIVIAALVLFAAGWGIWIYAYYPASFDIDCWRQLSSYYAVHGFAPENHHPWFATCVLGLFHSLGVSLGDEGLGIFIYVVSRDVLMALLYIRIALLSLRFGLKKRLSYGIIAFFALTPVWGAYAKHAFKDTASVGLFVWFILTIVILVRKFRRGETPGLLNYAECGIALLLASLFRGNIIYAALPAAFFLIIALLVKTRRILPVLFLVIPIAGYFGYYAYIFNNGVKPADVREKLSLPIQQTARTVKEYGWDLSPEEEKTILAYFRFGSLEEMGEKYDPILSDPIKGKTKDSISMSDPEVTNYMELWKTLALRYPDSYAKAAIGMSYGYYAFVPNQTAEGAGNYNSGMTLLDGMRMEEAEYVEDRQPLRDLLTDWAAVWDSLPLISITDVCAAYFWLVVALAVYWIRKGRWVEIIPVIPVVLITGTCMISPVNDCFRYFSLAAASLPVLLLLEGTWPRRSVEVSAQETEEAPGSADEVMAAVPGAGENEMPAAAEVTATVPGAEENEVTAVPDPLEDEMTAVPESLEDLVKAASDAGRTEGDR